jgi:O-antigen/teichoic acid export membrane protein
MTIDTPAKRFPVPAGDTAPRRQPLLKAAWTMAHRWKGRIFLAITDQGLASTANFLLTILCVLWLPLDDFGRYVIVWSISLLVETAQASLILDAMPAIVARYGQRNRRRLDVAGFWVVLIYAAGTSALILLAVPAFAYWAPEFTVPLLCLAASNPFQRLYVFLRRLCYIRDRQDTAAAASVAYSASLLGGAFVLFQLGLLSVPTAVLLWGFANGMAAVVIYGMGVARPGKSAPAHVGWLARQLWRSGRWLIGAAIGYWLSTWGILPLIAATSGVETAGVVRALQNLFTPIIQFNVAMNLMILPRVADKVVANGSRYARSFAIYSTGVFTGLVVLYAALVLSEARAVLEFIYRKPEIAAGAHLLWPLAIAMVLETARQGPSVALLALNRTPIFFVSRVVAVTVFIVGAMSLGRMLGAEGILWANALSHAVGALMFLSVVLNIKDNPRGAPSSRSGRQEMAAKISDWIFRAR